MDDEAADPGGYIRQINRHALCSASLAKLWEVSADPRVAPRLALPRLPSSCASKPPSASKRLVTGRHFFEMRTGGTAFSLWSGSAAALGWCLAAGRTKGLEPRCRRHEFVCRFAGDS
jgi:hypothetical protein